MNITRGPGLPNRAARSPRRREDGSWRRHERCQAAFRTTQDSPRSSRSPRSGTCESRAWRPARPGRRRSRAGQAASRNRGGRAQERVPLSPTRSCTRPSRSRHARRRAGRRAQRDTFVLFVPSVVKRPSDTSFAPSWCRAWVRSLASSRPALRIRTPPPRAAFGRSGPGSSARPTTPRGHHVAVDEHREVQVVAAGEARHAAPADDLPLVHLVARLHRELRQVSVERLDAHAVVDHHGVAVDAEFRREDDLAGVGRTTGAFWNEARSKPRCT